MTQPAVTRDAALSRTAVLVGVGITVVFAAAGATIHFVGEGAGVRSVTGPWGSIALGAVIATPGLLALIGLGRRPLLLAVASMLLLPMLVLSFSPLFFPLLIPAFIFAVFSLRPRPQPTSPWQAVAAAVSGLLVVAALAALLHPSAVSWSTAHESGTSSDAITASEAFIALACIVAALVVARIAPPDGAEEHPSS